MDIVKIGTYLAKLRHQHGLTQEELGEKLGVTNKTISRWETGKYLPPVEILEMLSDLYGITINEILNGSKLTDKQYKQKAEENIKNILSISAFGLQDRIDYFQKKWKNEHAFGLTIEMIIILIIIIVGWILNNELIIIGIVLGFGWSIFQYNRMKAYIEKNAFDGNQKDSS